MWAVTSWNRTFGQGADTASEPLGMECVMEMRRTVSWSLHPHMGLPKNPASLGHAGQGLRGLLSWLWTLASMEKVWSKPTGDFLEPEMLTLKTTCLQLILHRWPWTSREIQPLGPRKASGNWDASEKHIFFSCGWSQHAPHHLTFAYERPGNYYFHP